MTAIKDVFVIETPIDRLTCSYCKSIHGEEFSDIEVARAAINDATAHHKSVYEHDCRCVIVPAKEAPNEHR